MPTRRTALAALALLPTLARRAEARTATIILTRHAEKQDGPDPDLSPRGRRRADQLADMLVAARLTAIYTTDTRRTRQTVAPIAMRSNIEPGVYAGDIAPTLAELPDGARALVAGHSNTLPAIVRALGSRLEDLDDRGFLHDADYDRLVILTLHAENNHPLTAITVLDLRVDIHDQP